MSTENGYVKIYRDMLDNPVVCKDNDYFRVWLYLLLTATHKGYSAMFNGKKIELKAGQLITGRKSIAEKCNISESKAERILKSFKIERQIEQQTCNKHRLITILNWDKYQNSEQQIEQQVNIKRTTNEQQVNTNKNVKNVKNDKNVKNIKENVKRKVSDYETLINAYTDNENLINAIYGFIEMRKAIKKPLTENALKLIFNKLDKLSNIEADKVDILNQSTMNSWQGVFPLKNNNGGAENGNNRQYNGDDYSDIGWE